MENKKHTIYHLGKEFTTINFDPSISDEYCNEVRKKFYQKPSIDMVNKQLVSLRNGGTRHNHVIDYFIKQVLITAKLKASKWSIDEFMQSNDLIRFALAKVRNFPRVYLPKYSDVKNINTVFRISPSGTAPKVSNFPYKTMLEVLGKYNLNNNYYDYSCGWGVRMLSALNKDINYFGSEPNSDLVSQLNKLHRHHKSVIGAKSTVEIFEQGSEEHISGLDNTIGLAFSSPPYYDLEDYDYDEQSISERDYDTWLREYWLETVKNIKGYLIDGGYFLINIKDIRGYFLVDDMCGTIELNGFEYVEEFELKNINRVFLKQNGKNTNEKIYVFRKINK